MTVTIRRSVISSRTGRRKTYGNGRILPLVKRFTQAQLNERAAQILARRTRTDKLGMGQAILANALNNQGKILGGGFFARLRWLLLGPKRG